MDLGRVVAIHVVRFAAASQSSWALALHGIWMLLALAIWQASDPGADVKAFTRPLLRAFAWLGGFEAGGRGDERNIAQAMALLTLPIYLLASLRRTPVRERAPMFRTALKWGVVSGVVAFAGYVTVFVAGPGMADGIGFVPLVLAAVTGGATAWAVLVARIGDLIEAQLAPTPAQPPVPTRHGTTL